MPVGERRERLGAELPIGAAEPAAVRLAAGDDQSAAGCEGTAQIPQTAVARDVDDDVIALEAGEEILARVVDHVVRAQRPYGRELGGARDGRHPGAESMGELDGEGAHAAGGSRDQDVL